MGTVSDLTIVSIALATVGLVVFGSIMIGAWRYHHQRPSEIRFWMLVASAALTWSGLTILASAVASAIVQTDPSTLDTLAQMTAVLRGGVLAFAVALVYGSWHIFMLKDG